MRLFLAASLLLATAAEAQTAPAGQAGDARAKLMAADADKDGKWDKAEWLAAGRRERGFAFLDADKDGFVSQPELKEGMAKLQAIDASPQ